MSRLTGNGAKSLMEAYTSVYTPQELTEEQIWEEVESLVNSLLEEGYDLSEFTWDQIYEEYLNEMGQPGGNRPGGNRPKPTGPAPVNQFFSNLVNRFRNAAASNGNPQRRGQGGTDGSTVRYTRPRPQSSASTSRPAAIAPNPAASTSRPAPVAAPVAAKPAPVAAKPAPVAAKPAPVAAKPAPTSAAPAKPAGGAVADVAAPEKANILGNKPSELAALQAKAKADTLAKKKTVAARPMGARERMLNQDLDLFDVVKGHLLDEGYADTEEAALAIMSNMSEEWRNEIIESSCGGGHSKKKRKKSGY